MKQMYNFFFNFKLLIITIAASQPLFMSSKQQLRTSGRNVFQPSLIFCIIFLRNVINLILLWQYIGSNQKILSHSAKQFLTNVKPSYRVLTSLHLSLLYRAGN